MRLWSLFLVSVLFFHFQHYWVKRTLKSPPKLSWVLEVPWHAARADVGSEEEETVSRTKCRTWWCWVCCCRTSFPGPFQVSLLLFPSPTCSSYPTPTGSYQLFTRKHSDMSSEGDSTHLWAWGWGACLLQGRKKEAVAQKDLWLDADHLLSWLWWFSKGEAFFPRFLQSLENSVILGMSVESVMFPVPGSAGNGHAVSLSGLCALASAFTAECCCKGSIPRAWLSPCFAFYGLSVH